MFINYGDDNVRWCGDSDLEMRCQICENSDNHCVSCEQRRS